MRDQPFMNRNITLTPWHVALVIARQAIVTRSLLELLLFLIVAKLFLLDRLFVIFSSINA